MALILLSIGFGFLGTVPGDRSDWLFFLDTAVHWVWFQESGSGGRSDWLAFAIFQEGQF